MITLITGAPGAGKTSALVKLLGELSKSRPIYVDGIPDLKLPHFECNGREWPSAVPDGSVVVIDEVQRLWRPAGPGQRVPEDIALLETHRHRGLDFYIVTQHPKLVHSNVRNLVGRHIHLREMGVLGRWWYEWPEAADPSTFRSAPVKKRYRLSKSTFSLYTSASEHIKPVRSIPPALVVFVVALLGCGYMGWRVYDAIRSHGNLSAPAALTGGERPSAAPRAVGAGGSLPGTVRPGVQSLTGDQLARQFIPRWTTNPETAPAYDHLRVVRVMPRVVGGWCRAGVCRCYTNQGTDPGIGHDACARWIKSPPFDPYREVRAALVSESRGAHGGSVSALPSAPTPSL